METDLATDVIIAGAGPTGLALAAQLVRWGIDCMILDKKEHVTDLSKALVVHARTLEIYDQLGLAQKAVEQGAQVEHAVIIHGGKDRATLDFSEVGGRLSPFPFLLLFEQSKNERLLYGYLEQAGRPVLWNTTLTEITQDEDGVRATLQTEGESPRTVAARYLVGCDGASSVTRHLLGLGFEGSTHPHIFYVADVEMEYEGDRSTLQVVFEADSFVLFFPMQGEKRWRLIGPLPAYEQALREHPAQEEPISFDAIEAQVKTLLKRPLDITKTNWFSTYKVHTRHAEVFGKGRCFLAGDAAHVHTPVGGQGMNTGIQDAYNLAWKLALVIKGQAASGLLDTYNTERLANAKRLLETTDRFFAIAAGDTWYQRFFRDHMLPNLANVAWRFDAVKELLFPTISQIGIHYPDSPLSHHAGDHGFQVKAGDRMPYFLVDGVSVYDHLRAPSFHLLAFADGEHGTAPVPSDLQAKYGHRLDFHAFPLLPRIAEIFGYDRAFSMLLRPDNHIALLAPNLSSEEVMGYLDSLGVTATPR